MIMIYDMIMIWYDIRYDMWYDDYDIWYDMIWYDMIWLIWYMIHMIYDIC